MKLARITLPDRDNEGKTLFVEHRHLQHIIVELWGGYTCHGAGGAWAKDPETVVRESVVVYEIAMERADVLKLREVARKVCVEARQECVMIVTPNGDVEFVKP